MNKKSAVFRMLLSIGLLASGSSFAQSSLIGDYTINSGDSTCEKFVSIIETERETDSGVVSGLSFLPTKSIGTTFEAEQADDFLNINAGSVEITNKSSSHGTIYVEKAKSRSTWNSLSKKATLKQYNLGGRARKTNISVDIVQDGEYIQYQKVMSGSDQWSRSCWYKKN